MLVVHGGWVPAGGRRSGPRTRPRDSSRPRTRTHPFARPLAAATLAGRRRLRRQTVRRSQPARAPPGVRSPPPETGARRRRPAGVKLARLGHTGAAAARPCRAGRARRPRRARPGRPWLAGASLRYLCVLAGHACDLARRGRMLPQLVTEAGVPAARWRPVLTGADAATYRDFAAGDAAGLPAADRHAGTGRRDPARRARAPGRRRGPGGACRSGCCSGTGPGRRRRCPTGGSPR